MKLKLVLFFFIILSLQFSLYAQHQSIIAKIKLDRQEEFTTLRAFVVNEQLIYADHLYYNLVALKKSNSGNLSKSNQSGSFSLQPKEEKILSELKVNVTCNDELRVYLFIKQKEKLIYRDTLFISSIVSKKQVASKNTVSELDFVLRGIVIDEAITRIGKEYHDIFYKEYLVTRRNYPFIVKIKEKPAMGSSSIVMVLAEGKTIHQFYVKPQEDYLKRNVAIAMQNLRKYSRTRRNILSY